jgi:HTH-type transcriptional regulator, competence development regulator
MAATDKRTFGAVVRREREAKKIGLREMAKMIGISPTYLSKIERDEFLPPAEDKVKAIAKIIGSDTDELLALAGKVSSDLTEIIRRQPREMASILRSVRQPLATNETARLRKKVRKAKKR